MAKIYIIGYRGISWTSKIIRRFTFGPFSHVEWLINPQTLEGFGAFEKLGGVDFTGPHLHKPETKYDIWSISCTSREKKLFEEFNLEQKGKKYDWPGILGFAKFKNNEDPDKWFCSELVAAACKYADIPILNWEYIHPGIISPNKFALSPLLHLERRGQVLK